MAGRSSCREQWAAPARPYGRIRVGCSPVYICPAVFGLDRLWATPTCQTQQKRARPGSPAAPGLYSRCASRNRRRILKPACAVVRQARKPWDDPRTTRNPTLLFLSLMFLLRLDERTSCLSQPPQKPANHTGCCQSKKNPIRRRRILTGRGTPPALPSAARLTALRRKAVFSKNRDQRKAENSGSGRGTTPAPPETQRGCPRRG